MRCPSCANENPPESRFCEECGACLEPAAPAGGAAAPRGPVAEGLEVSGRFSVCRLVEAGRVRTYQGRALEDPADALLLLEASAEDQGPLEAQWALGEEVEGPWLWRPSARLEEGGRLWLVGPWPGGEPLAGRLAEGVLGLEALVRLGEGMLEAVGALHAAGWLHGALSPASVWLDGEGGVRLVRLDRALRAGEAREEYAVTEGYSSPEAYGMQGGILDARSDLFSLGAILYSALTGERPNLEARESFFAFPRPAGAGPLAEVILRAVSREPGGRYPSAAAMLEAWREAAARQASALPSPEADPPPAPPPAARSAPAPGAAPSLVEPGPVEGEAPPSGAEPPPSGAESPPSGVAGAPATPEGAEAPSAGPPARAGGLEVAMRSHVGMVRQVNQDACLDLRLEATERDRPIQARLVVVADGMGGEAEGDKAASLAIRALSHEVIERFLAVPSGGETAPLLSTDPAERNAEILKRGLERANRTIFRYAEAAPHRRGMGCTITAALLEGDQVAFAHVGDTRAYVVGEGLDQVTTDHSLVGSLVQMGHLSREEARHHPQRSVIYRALGTSPEVEVDLYRRTLAPGSLLLLSSDGVWEYFEDQELLRVCRELEGAPLAGLCQRLVETCLERGADDNATVAAARWA